MTVSPNYLSPFKASHHLDAIASLRRGLMVAPKNIQIDLEAFCPHSCEFCTYRNVGWQDYKPAPMQFEEPKRLVEGVTGFPRSLALSIPSQMVEAGIPSIEITGGGESLVYPHIKDFLQECAYHNIEIGLVTNGVAFTSGVREVMRRDKLKWVRFSVDAITPSVYSSVHRTSAGAFSGLLRNIQELIAWRDDSVTLIGISFVITKHNYIQIAEAATFFKQLGVDSIRYTFTFDPNGDGALDPSQRQAALEALRLAEHETCDTFHVFGVNRLDVYSRPNNDFSTCGHQHFVWAIGYNGKVYPCCIMKYHEGYEIGDLTKQTLKEVVFSDARREFARNLIVSQCKPCYLRDKNRFIEYLLDNDPAHVNFV